MNESSLKKIEQAKVDAEHTHIMDVSYGFKESVFEIEAKPFLDLMDERDAMRSEIKNLLGEPHHGEGLPVARDKAIREKFDL